MQILSFNFFVYSLSGIWRPVEWSSSCAKLLYNAFTVCTVVQMYFLVLTQLIDLIFIVDNIDDFTNNSLLLVSMIAVCCKATVVVLRRSAIIKLVEMLLREPCKPRDEDELKIQTRFDGFIRSSSIKFAVIATTSVTSITLKSVIYVMQGQLPYRVWLPYDSTKSPMFLITSIHHIITLILATYINIGTETLVFGFILQTCAQLDILKNRLTKSVKQSVNQMANYQENRLFPLPNKKQSIISEQIRHHLNIYTYAKTVNNIFSQVFFVQFFGSIFVLCTCVYYISTHITESEVMSTLMYTASMFVQIFIYCWSGNEVMLKSMNLADAVYHVDWPLLSVNERKDLLLIMRRSAVPIKFTSSFLITLSLQSYGNILKTSYSAFNVLQQS